MILQSYLHILFGFFFTDTESELTLYSGILFLVEEMKVKDTLHLYYLYVSIDFLGSSIERSFCRQNLIEMIIFFRFCSASCNLFDTRKRISCGKYRLLKSYSDSQFRFHIFSRSNLQDAISESFGMFAHVVNIVVLVLIPMVVIHIKGHAFSLSELIEILGIDFQCRQHNQPYQLNSIEDTICLLILMIFSSGCFGCMFPVLGPFYESLELCAG